MGWNFLRLPLGAAQVAGELRRHPEGDGVLAVQGLDAILGAVEVAGERDCDDIVATPSLGHRLDTAILVDVQLVEVPREVTVRRNRGAVDCARDVEDAVAPILIERAGGDLHADVDVVRVDTGGVTRDGAISRGALEGGVPGGLVGLARKLTEVVQLSGVGVALALLEDRGDRVADICASGGVHGGITARPHGEGQEDGGSDHQLIQHLPSPDPKGSEL